MYSEIKSGAACNTLVSEYVLRKNARGDAKLDTGVSPFLRDNLRDPLPSLAERQRRHRRRQAPAAEAAKSAAFNPANIGSKQNTTSRPGADSVSVATAPVTGESTTVQDVDDSAWRKNHEGITFANDRNDSFAHPAGREGHFPQTRIGRRNGKSRDRDDGISGENEARAERLLLRPTNMEPVGGHAGRTRDGRTAYDADKHQSLQRSRGAAGDSEQIHSDVKIPRRHGGFGNHPTDRGTDQGFACNIHDGRRRRKENEIPDISGRGDGINCAGGRGRQITTSASLKTLSLREMGERQHNFTGHETAGDALDRWVVQLRSNLHIEVTPRSRISMMRMSPSSHRLPYIDVQRWRSNASYVSCLGPRGTWFFLP